MNTFIMIWMALIATFIVLLVLRFIFIKGNRQTSFSDEYDDYFKVHGSAVGFVPVQAFSDNNLNSQQDLSQQPYNDFSSGDIHTTERVQSHELVHEHELSHAESYSGSDSLQHSDSSFNNFSADSSSYDSGWSGSSDSSFSSDSSSSADSSSGSSSSSD